LLGEIRRTAVRLLRWARLTLLVAALAWAIILALGARNLGEEESLYLSGIIAGWIVIASAVACVGIQLIGWIIRRQR
jgi:hypothetical protein